MLTTSLEQAIEKGGELGFDHIEFLMEDELDPRSVRERGDELSKLASDHGVEFLVHLPFHEKRRSALGACDDEVRQRSVDEMQQCIEASRQIGATKGVLHVESDDSPHLADQGRHDLIIDILRSLDGYASDRGFELCVENLPERYPDLTDLKHIIENTDVSLTLDTGHARVNGNNSDDVATFLTEHKDRVSHVHINDTRDPVDEHLPFELGTIDFEEMFGPLQHDWTGTFSFEIGTDDFEYIQLSKQKLDNLI